MGDILNHGDVEIRYGSDFARIKNRQFYDDEEARHEYPAVTASAVGYSGLAPAGSLSSDAVWSIVRTDFDANGNPSRERIQKGISWDNRAVGWT